MDHNSFRPLDEEEIVVNARPDRELTKRIIKRGNYELVPYEDAKCKVVITDVNFCNEHGTCEIDDSHYFSSSFNGNIVIGDCNSYIDKDLDLILQQMCSGEVCSIKMVYRNIEGRIAKEITANVELKETSNEILVSDWNYERLFETAQRHKECGVQLVQQKRITDAFRRFSKAFKLLVAIEPVDPEVVPEEKVEEIINLKVKLYNNLAHCQLYYDEYEAALDLCNRALQYDPENIKTLYRRCLAYTGLKMYEVAWADITHVLQLDPNDKSAQQKAKQLRPAIEEINKNYAGVVKKMFG